MKTAKEWQEQPCFNTPEEYVKAIQQDAYQAGMLQAAKMVRRNKFAYGVDILTRQAISESIEAEAEKGMP